jgi:hypothetical protein
MMDGWRKKGKTKPKNEKLRSLNRSREATTTDNRLRNNISHSKIRRTSFAIKPYTYLTLFCHDNVISKKENY